MTHYGNPRTHGQALIGLIIAMAIIAIVTAAMMGQFKEGIYKNSMDRGAQVGCISYTSQFQQAIMMYKQDNDGKNPPSLAALSKYGVVPDMYNDPNCSYGYDPATGRVQPPRSMRPGDPPAAPVANNSGPSAAPASAQAPAPAPAQSPGGSSSTTVSGPGGISIKVPTGGGNTDVNGGN